MLCVTHDTHPQISEVSLFVPTEQWRKTLLESFSNPWKSDLLRLGFFRIVIQGLSSAVAFHSVFLNKNIWLESTWKTYWILSTEYYDFFCSIAFSKCLFSIKPAYLRKKLRLSFISLTSHTLKCNNSFGRCVMSPLLGTEVSVLD